MKDIQLVIPMSGLGSRFVDAGYTAPKPLIPVHRRPMIEWVLRLFPGSKAPIFICRREHIEQTNMRQVLLVLQPDAQIVVIEGAKKGPVDAVLKAEHAIPDDAPILVSYCDYSMQWSYESFKAQVATTNCDGAIPCYTGFHPHLLPQKNLYACCRVDGKGYLTELREKHSFESDKTKALHSPGAYYFKSGAIMKKYSRQLMEKDDSLGGEYYVSMVYNHLVSDGLKVLVTTDIPHFCQWGTPEDFADYLFWTEMVKDYAK